MILFNGFDGSNLGRVTVLEQWDASAGSLLDVSDWGGFYEMKAIFTELGIAGITNQQFAHTLGERIYLNVFGDRIGQFTLGGIAFYNICGGNPQDGTGLTHVLNYYNANRVSRRESPVLITLDPSMVLECYLTSIQARTLSTAERLFQFNLTLALLPPDDLREDSDWLAFTDKLQGVAASDESNAPAASTDTSDADYYAARHPDFDMPMSSVPMP